VDGINLELEDSVMHLIRRAERCAIIALERHAAELTPTQISVLTAAGATPGSSQTTLCRMTGIDRSTMADVVLRMVKKGLLKRLRSKDDARAYTVELSHDGRQALARAIPLAAKAEEEFLAALTPSTRMALLRSLRQIIEACEIDMGLRKRSDPATHADGETDDHAKKD
jgi:DNA-binding MarR family transcriptional regulator